MPRPGVVPEVPGPGSHPGGEVLLKPPVPLAGEHKGEERDQEDPMARPQGVGEGPDSHLAQAEHSPSDEGEHAGNAPGGSDRAHE
jgi:hypothetical protein